MTDESDFVVLTDEGCFRIINNKGKLTLFIKSNVSAEVKQIKKGRTIIPNPRINDLLGCIIEIGNNRVYEVIGIYQRIA
jgi:hypothetical protein